MCNISKESINRLRDAGVTVRVISEESEEKSTFQKEQKKLERIAQIRTKANGYLDNIEIDVR